MENQEEKKIKIEKEQERTVKLSDILGSVLTSNVNLSKEEYTKLLNEVAQTYDKNNESDHKGTQPTISERRKRIQSNYYGTTLNFLFQITNMLNDFYANYAPLIIAIAEKVGVDFEVVESEEDKAMKAAAKYLNENAALKKAEREKIEKENLNREQRRKLNKKEK